MVFRFFKNTVKFSLVFFYLLYLSQPCLLAMEEAEDISQLDSKGGPTSTSKTILITGATNGLGRIAAKTLAEQDAHLIIIARSQEKMDETHAEILRSVPSAKIDFEYADFTRLSTVADAALKIAEKYQRIDVLINNAGIHAFEQRITADGFGEMVSVNYLAPWLLTSILRQRLAESAPSRIITVASEASRQSKSLDPTRDLTDTTTYTFLGSSQYYGRTKLMNIMFSMELARQLKDTGVVVNCLCPGFNVTGLGREVPFAGLLEKVLKLFSVGDPNRGASIIVQLASDAAFANVSGGYFSVDGKSITPIDIGNDITAQQLLWTETAKLMRKYNPFNE
jgi:NAD(P)-dependent dehydrogenase (short-subunit alcohol dehydrogenase family)